MGSTCDYQPISPEAWVTPATLSSSRDPVAMTNIGSAMDSLEAVSGDIPCILKIHIDFVQVGICNPSHSRKTSF